MPIYSLHELCRMSGVTRKALRIYDEMGLVSPMERGEGEYRYYDETAVTRLYEVLAFKEMGFALREIQRLLDDPTFDRRSVIENQIEELERQKAKYEALIGFAEMVVFSGILPIPKVDGDEYPLIQYLSDYVEEANLDKRLKETEEAYKKEPQRFDEVNTAFEELFALCSEPPESKVVQRKVKEIRKLLREKFDLRFIEEFRMTARIMISGGAYDEILREEYPSDAIDFAACAIEAYCDRVIKKRDSYVPPLEIKSIFKEETKDG